MGDVIFYNENGQKRRNHLFCIGINEYAHVSKLSNAVSDVEAFASLLTKEYNFQKEHIHLLTDQKASRIAIIEQLKEYASTLTDNDNLILYFSGHGIKEKLTDEGFWIPVEGEKGNESSWLANETVMRYIRSMKAHHILLLIDACFSGSFFVQARSLESKYDVSPSRFAITSGSEEIVSDGPVGQNSPFAHTVLRFLENNQEPVIGVGRLFEEVKKHIPSSQKPQARHLEIRGKLFDGEFCFYRKGKVKEEISKETQKRVDGLFEIPDPPKNTGTSSENKMGHPILRELGVEMVRVEGGSFLRGNNVEGNRGFKNRAPLAKVTLPGFYIGKYPVTQAQWQRVMGDNPAKYQGDLQLPVENVSWEDCHMFIDRLNELTGEHFRLPSESEWEYAAKSGIANESYSFSGSNDPDEVAWHNKNSNNTTHPVGKKKPNTLGVHDMSGNIYEWCEDDWHKNYKKSPIDGGPLIKNPLFKDRGKEKVARGGGIFSSYLDCKVSNRYNFLPTYRQSFVGFRLALSS